MLKKQKTKSKIDFTSYAFMVCAENAAWPHGECWSLGDEGTIATLLEEREQTDIYDEIPAPTFAEDMRKRIRISLCCAVIPEAARL